MRPDIRGYLHRWKQQVGRGGLQQNPNPNLSSENYDINKPSEISDYIQKRFLPILRWYKNRTSVNARRFRFWRISIIILTLFIVIFDISALGYYAGRNSAASAVASSIVCRSDTWVYGIRSTNKNSRKLDTVQHSFTKVRKRISTVYVKSGIYSPSTPPVSTSVDEDNQAKSRLFVESIENIISNHTSESRFQNPSAANQIPD